MFFFNKVNFYIFGDKGSGFNDKIILICYYVFLVIFNGKIGIVLVNCFVLIRFIVIFLLIKVVGFMIKLCFRCLGFGMLFIFIVFYCVFNV